MAHVGTVSVYSDGFEDCLNKAKQAMSPEELQGELDYWRSKKILQKMLYKGLITSDEFHKIDVLNRRSFSPKLAQLMA